MPRHPVDVDLRGVWSTDDDQTASFDLQAHFGNENPTELDIGCGKGLFLFNQAQTKPDVNFLGIDWSRAYSRLAAARIVRAGIPNVRVVAGDAWRLFPKFPDESFQAIHVYFPDPWWKRRHRKRRLVRPEFIEQVDRLLKPNGRLSVATDVGEYFEVMRKVIATSRRLQQSPVPSPFQGPTDSEYLTNFERKYRKAGRTIQSAQYVRCDALSDAAIQP